MQQRQPRAVRLAVAGQHAQRTQAALDQPVGQRVDVERGLLRQAAQVDGHGLVAEKIGRCVEVALQRLAQRLRVAGSRAQQQGVDGA